MTPVSAPTPNAIRNPVGGLGPAVERTSLQEEVSTLLGQIENAHSTLDAMTGVGAAVPSQSSMVLSTGINYARERMAHLNDRLSELARVTGAI